jgi:hypothetical protein
VYPTNSYPSDFHLCDDRECEEPQCVQYCADIDANSDYLEASFVDTTGWAGVDTWEPSSPRTALFLEDGTLLPF